MNVVHCKIDKYTIYIGRPSVLGNPYVIGKDGSRDEVCDKFEEYVKNTPKVLDAIKNLNDNDILGCWCKQKNKNVRCHGDSIVKIYNSLKAVQSDNRDSNGELSKK